MYRAIPVTRQVSSTAGRGLVRITRRRLATTTPSTATKQSKSVVRKILFYSVAATGTFYVGSAFVSFENQRYRDLFTENVPMGQALVEYGEAHKWDELTIEKVVVSSVDTFKHVSDFVQQQLATFSQNSSEKDKDGASEKARAVKEITSSAIQESKVRVKAAAAALKTAVKKSEDNLSEGGAKAGAIARHQAAQLNDSIDDLIRRAEAALADKTIDPLPEARTTPAQPESSPPDSTPPRANDVEAIIVSDPNVYDASLPIGFEPPPGYSRPAPKKDAPKPTSLPVESAHEPLPLVAPVVSTLAASEPVISQLASTIDNLASYINSNPAAAEKAKSVLETAKTDITQLAERMEKIKENEQLQLQQRLDEQTREYSLKLVELEMQAQDTLDNQQEDFRKFYDSEKARFQQIYREKLDQELKTQIELINERLKEEVIAQGIEMQRRWIREVKVRVEQERGGRLAKLDELASNLKRLERIALDNSSYLDENIRIHGMWTAIRAMHAAVEAPTRKPFREELRVLRHIAAAKDDTIISSALESLESSDVPDVGVEPFADLASWFTTSVAPRVSSVALVPDQNAGVLSHLASHLLSSFRFQRHGLVQGSDVLSVLSRAEYFMNEKDLDNAARELNQLQGTAKVLLQDWLEAARKRLEVQQALEVIQSQATVASLLVV